MFAAVATTTAVILAVIALVTAGEDEVSRTIELVTISDPGRRRSPISPRRASRRATWLCSRRRPGRTVSRSAEHSDPARSRTEEQGRGVCSLTTEFEDGKITAAGTIDFRREGQPQDLPIVGGTGEFENASGTMTLKGGEKETPLTINLTTEDGE